MESVCIEYLQKLLGWSAEKRADLNEQNYNELRSMFLAMRASSPEVASVDVPNGSPEVGSVDADIGLSVGASNVVESTDPGNGVVSSSRGVGSLCAHKGPEHVNPDVVEQSAGIDKRVVGASKHHTTVHHDKQERAKVNGQQVQSLSSDNAVHVDELNKARAKMVGQKQEKTGREVALRSSSCSKIVAMGDLVAQTKLLKA